MGSRARGKDDKVVTDRYPTRSFLKVRPHSAVLTRTGIIIMPRLNTINQSVKAAALSEHYYEIQ